MGCHPNIDYAKFPRQGEHKGKRARVIFHYGQENLKGKIIRDDMEEPFLTVIQLDDGRCVLGTECQYGVEP